MKKVALILAVVMGLSTVSFGASCKDTMAFHVSTATDAAKMGLMAKEIGEKHRVKRVETEIVSSLFWFQLNILYEGRCKRVGAAIAELFELRD